MGSDHVTETCQGFVVQVSGELLDDHVGAFPLAVVFHIRVLEDLRVGLRSIDVCLDFVNLPKSPELRQVKV